MLGGTACTPDSKPVKNVKTAQVGAGVMVAVGKPVTVRVGEEVTVVVMLALGVLVVAVKSTQPSSAISLRFAFVPAAVIIKRQRFATTKPKLMFLAKTEPPTFPDVPLLCSVSPTKIHPLGLEDPKGMASIRKPARGPEYQIDTLLPRRGAFSWNSMTSPTVTNLAEARNDPSKSAKFCALGGTGWTPELVNICSAAQVGAKVLVTVEEGEFVRLNVEVALGVDETAWVSTQPSRTISLSTALGAAVVMISLQRLATSPLKLMFFAK